MDAETLIRHAMQDLDDRYGVDRAWPVVQKLHGVLKDIRHLENPNSPADTGLTSVGQIIADIAWDENAGGKRLA